MASGITKHTRTSMKADKRTGVKRPVQVTYWRARYYDDAGVQHEMRFDLEGEAERWRGDATAALASGQWVDPRDGRMTVAEYAVGWEANLVASAAQVRIVDNALRLHVLPVLGARPFASLRRSDVQGLVKRLSGQLGPGSVRNVYEVLARMLADAVADRIIAASPCQKITLPRMPDHEVRPPTEEQIAAIVAELPARYRVVPLLLVGSGLRIGEALGLAVPKHVDFLRRSVRVERQRLQNGKIGPPKSSASVRTVPLAPWVLDAGAAHLAAYPAAADGSLLTAGAGQPLRYQTWKQVWTAANKAAGLDFDTHDLRHAYASMLISGGASVKAVQAALGHSSAVITLRVYSHLWPGDEDRTRDIIQAGFELLRAQQGLKDLGSDETAGQRP